MKKLLTAFIALGIASSSLAADWPMYRANAQRNGYTPEELPEKLTIRWVHKSPPPRPAWPRAVNGGVLYDPVNHPIVSNGLVFFGSSQGGKVYALDAATGKEKWTFFTEGPVRFAPAAWKDRLFVGSDDGYLYCLEAATGKFVWKKRGGPREEKILGNDRVVSLWPVRGGVAVLEDKVYFGAGIWPGDGAYLHALDAATGKTLWTADTGAIFVERKGTSYEFRDDKGLAFQGYLAAAADRVACTNGRITASVYERATGKLAYASIGYGRSAAAIVDSYLTYQNGGIYDLDTGEILFNDKRFGLYAYNVTATPQWIFWADPRTKRVQGVPRAAPLKPHAKKPKQQVLDVKWQSKWKGTPGHALIGAGRRLYLGEINERGNKVHAIDIETQETVWSVPVEGRTWGLAAAGGRLYAVTDKGYLYCLDGGTGEPRTIEPKRVPGSSASAASKAAGEILEISGITKGYCVDLGCGDGSLAVELVRKSELYVVAVDKDPAMVERARQRLDAAGFYGVRAVVLGADPAKTFLPKWFANLVVSWRSVEGGEGGVPAAEAGRIQRPYGGVVVSGKPGAMKKNVRGPLKGGGSWMHCWGDVGNSACSGDSVLKAPLRAFWYRDHDVLTRTGAGASGECPAPLFVEGRLYVFGWDNICAVDAYNGHTIWKLPIKLTYLLGTGHITSAGYVCASRDSLYVRYGSRILRIDGLTGKQTGTFEAPKKSDGTDNIWAYVAFHDGTLFGAIAAERVLRPLKTLGRPEALALIALDPATGKTMWTYTATQSVPISSIVIGGGRVYLIDRETLVPSPGGRAYQFRPHEGMGDLVALNAAKGTVEWRNTVEKLYASILALSAEHGVFLLTNQGTNKGKLTFTGSNSNLSAFRTSDGKQLWVKDGKDWGSRGYRSRPIIIDRTVYLQGKNKAFVFDLLTGKPKPPEGLDKPWTFQRPFKACGKVVGSRNLLVFRTGSLAWADLRSHKGTEYYAGIRNNCYISSIPAGGLVLMPDLVNCGCPYNRAWIALQGAE